LLSAGALGCAAGSVFWAGAGAAAGLAASGGGLTGSVEGFGAGGCDGVAAAAA
jgi:hypothetical protein